MCNATAALHAACLALKLGPGDLLWTSPITFVASANCARYCGADVDFVDIDPEPTTCPSRGSPRSSSKPNVRDACPRSSFPCIWRGKAPRCARLRSSPGATASGSSRMRRTPLALNYARQARRQLPIQRHHRLQLPSGQDHHHRRGRHGHDQRRRACPAAWLASEATALRESRRNSGTSRRARGITSSSNSVTITG